MKTLFQVRKINYMMQCIFIYPLVVLFLLASSACRKVDRPDRPNVILIMTDDQGYGDLAFTGNPFIQTPNLDEFHSEALRFTDFHVDVICTPTRSALMTGRNSSRTGAWYAISGRTMLHEDEITMAEIFRDNGYQTGIFGKWHLGDVYPHRPQDNGFQKAVWHKGSKVGDPPDYWGNDYFDDTYEDNGELKEYAGYCTDVWFEEALKYIESCRGRPFFVYLPTNAPHGPFLVEEKYALPYKDNENVHNANFYGMIANIDENFGLLRAKLQEWEIEDNTILIFLTDNGSSGGSNTSLDGWPTVGYAAGMRGMKGSLYEGGHRVPCMIRWPGGEITGGKDIDQLAAHYDLLPTLMELCGLERPENALPMDGRSVVPLLMGDTDSWPERKLIIQFQGGAYFRYAPQPWTETVVMTENWRLVGGEELYEITADPGQQNDVSLEHPAVVEELRKEYAPFWEQVKPRVMTPVRIHIGSEEQNPLTLNTWDWYMPVGYSVTSQSQMDKIVPRQGPWKLYVTRDGMYRFTLRQKPEVAAFPIDAETARLRISDYDHTIEMPQGAEAVVFEVTLKSGEADLDTWFIQHDGNSGGAYIAEVELIEDD